MKIALLLVNITLRIQQGENQLVINRLPKVLKCSKQFQLVMVRVGLEAKIPLMIASSAPITVQCIIILFCIIILSLIFELFLQLTFIFQIIDHC